MRFAIGLIAAALVAHASGAAEVSFKKTMPPRQQIDAPSNRIALLKMDGDTAECAHVFLRITFKDAILASGAEFQDVSHLKTSLEDRRSSLDADLYIESESCSCRSSQRPVGDGTSWYAGACQARFRLRDREGRDLGTVTVKGQSEEKTDVLDFAAHITSGKRMMAQMAQMIRPYESTITIDTGRNVPGEKEAARLLRKRDFAGARAVWERELASQPEHAGIHFSLAAVTEALGDIEAARHHYEEATRLAPEIERYTRFKGYFESRNR
jgi:tetratricopeptide (TPR) repeat protein